MQALLHCLLYFLFGDDLVEALSVGVGEVDRDAGPFLGGRLDDAGVVGGGVQSVVMRTPVSSSARLLAATGLERDAAS